jgi:putative hydroxymethylpyrimidine transport system substrate-binding protein
MLNRRCRLLAAAALTCAATAPATEKLTVVLDWLLGTDHAALFAALNSGAFARAGLDVQLIPPSDPDLPSRLVAAGQADLAIGYGTQINMIDSAGLPLVRIATLIDKPLNTLMALGDGAIRTLADLKGKTIGYSVAGVEDAILGTMLQSAGLAFSDVTTVKITYDMVSALLARRLDAAIGAFRNVEVLQVQMMGERPSVFLPEQHGVPPYDELIVLARRDRLADPRLRYFLAGLQHGTGLLLEDPDAVWHAFVAAHPELDTALDRASWRATLPAIAKTPARLDAQRYLAFQDFALAHGIASRRLPLDAFAVQIA